MTAKRCWWRSTDTTLNVYKSIRNLQGVAVLPVADLNALDVLRPKRLLMTKAALEAFRSNATAKQAS